MPSALARSHAFAITLTGVLAMFALRIIAFCRKRKILKRRFARQISPINQDLIRLNQDIVDVPGAPFAFDL